MSRSDRDAPSVAESFDVLRKFLADLPGTAPAAILGRRAIRRAPARTSPSGPVIVVGNGVDRAYRLPPTLEAARHRGGLGTLRGAATELRVLLVDLTGPDLSRALGRAPGGDG